MNQSQATPETAPTKEVPLWTWPYVVVCLSTFLGYVNYAMFNPTLPLFVDGLGASGVMIGLTYGAFSGASFLVRPFVGKLVDTGSPRLMLGAGSLLVGLGSIPCLFPNLGAIFVGRFIQGIGWSGLNVGSSSMVAALAPPSRRGESSGYFQTAIRIGTGLFAPFGIWLMTVANFPTVVIVATAAAFVSAVLAFILREAPRPTQVRRGGTFIQSLYDPSALFPGVLLFLANLAFPAAVIFIPLYARSLSTGGNVTISANDVALILLAQGITGIIIQATLGRLSDRIGRAPTIALGLAISMIGLLFLGQGHSTLALGLGASVYMFGFGIVNPALMAMVIDRAQPSRMGAAIATYSTAFQLGNAVGAPIAGAIIGLAGYQALYIASIIPQFIGFVLVLYIWNSGRNATNARKQPSPS